MDNKNDLNRIGLFSELGYISIGDPYVMPNSKPFNVNASKGKQMLPGGSKTKSALQNGYFDKTFVRTLEGEAYSDAVKRRRQDRIKESKKNISKAFMPSHAGKEPSGAGCHYGTFSGPITAFTPQTKSKAMYKSPGRNFITNPLKNGTGYGYVNVLIGKSQTYSEEPYDRGRELAKKGQDESKGKMKGGAFRLNLCPKQFFDSNPYKTDKPLPPIKESSKAKADLKPFKQSSPGKERPAALPHHICISQSTIEKNSPLLLEHCLDIKRGRTQGEREGAVRMGNKMDSSNSRMSMLVCFIKMFTTRSAFLYAVVCVVGISESHALQSVNVSIKGFGVCQGMTENLLGKTVDVFKGIPYAKPPIGRLRFHPPQDADTWYGFVNAMEFGHPCPQMDTGGGGVIGSEDCLTLNVYRPSRHDASVKLHQQQQQQQQTNKYLAVMVWIHGGSFMLDSAQSYDGRVLSTTRDVIVVTLNYRLGVLAFFNMPNSPARGNYGLLDQISALRWVQRNIASFGGDAKRVTIFGLSAGAASVSLHSISPLVRDKGLFHRVIAQSGVATCPWAVSRVEDHSKAMYFARLINCKDRSDVVECMRRKDWRDIVSKQSKVYIRQIMGPVVDDYYLKELPSEQQAAGTLQFANVPQVIGFDMNEGTAFAGDPKQLSQETFKDKVKEAMKGYDFNAKQKTVFLQTVLRHYINSSLIGQENFWFDVTSQLIADYWFEKDSSEFVEALVRKKRDAYFYVFTHLPKYLLHPHWKVAHALEKPFVFGSPLLGQPLYLLTNFTEQDKTVSRQLMQLWTNFAKFGRPGKLWPSYTSTEKKYVEIDTAITVKKNDIPERLAFFYNFTLALKPTDDTKVYSSDVHPSPLKGLQMSLIGGSKAGCFDNYPSHSNDPYVVSKKPTRGAVGTDDKKIFKPSQGPKSKPTKSVISQNVERRINRTNFKQQLPLTV
eukprot:gene12154-13408_t